MLPPRDFGTKERESEVREVVLGTLLKLLVKHKLLHSGKIHMNAKLRPLTREKRERKLSDTALLDIAISMYLLFVQQHRTKPVLSYIISLVLKRNPENKAKH